MNRADELIATLGLRAHPEGGHYAECFRSRHEVDALDGRPRRQALTSIDFLLRHGERSAWHRVVSDEAWHLLEGEGLVLWVAPPALDRVERIELGTAHATRRPRHVVPALWWQAAEPVGDFAYVGATVGPGFEFDDFAFGRDDDSLVKALQGPLHTALWGGLSRLL